MTLASASREVIRRAWVLPVAALIVGAGAYLVASRHHSSWSASAVVSHTPVKVKSGPHGLKRIAKVPTPAALAITTDYLRPPADVTLGENSRSTVAVVAKGPSIGVVNRAVTSYLGRLRKHWENEFSKAQGKALAAINHRSHSKHVTPAEVASAIAAAKAVKPSMSIGTVAVKQTSNPVHALSAALLGAVSGLLLGLLAILGVYALRGQIWSADELTPLGMEVVSIDSGDPGAVHRLRVELEARGLGHGQRSVLIAPASGRERWTPIAQALASSFGATGADTVLLSAHPANAEAEPGVADFLADPARGITLRRVADHVDFLSAGRDGAPTAPTLTADGVTALLAEAGRHARVAVIDGPPLDSPFGSLLLAAADICVVAAHRKYSAAGPLTSAVLHVRRITSRAPLLCFDKAVGRRPGHEAASTPFGEDKGARREEVPANANQ